MRRHAALITLLAFQAIVLGLSLAFQLGARVSVLAAFHAYGTEIPPLAAIALAPWLLPVANGISLAISLAALVAPLRRSQRGAAIALGLVVASTALVFAVIAAFAPIFNPA